MAHPNIMTENVRDGSDAIADWPLLNKQVHHSSVVSGYADQSSDQVRGRV
jgi:urocanate hydratase